MLNLRIVFDRIKIIVPRNRQMNVVFFRTKIIVPRNVCIDYLIKLNGNDVKKKRFPFIVSIPTMFIRH